MALYEGQLPAFRALLANCDSEFACFYAAVGRLAKLPESERQEQLESLVTP